MAVGKERHLRNKKKKTSENNGWTLTTRNLSLTDFSRDSKQQLDQQRRALGCLKNLYTCAMSDLHQWL